jgi:integrase/recombinase XerD
MPVLFRTIYACGLRASEARLLRFDDVDIDAGVLTIRDGKGGKDRQVPVSAALRDRLADYHARVAGRTGGDWFFPGTAGQPLTLANIDKNFRRFLWQARIPHGGKGHGPRVHDLRHVFAVNNLRRGSPPARTSARCCRSCRPTWVIPRSPTPTTTSG